MRASKSLITVSLLLSSILIPSGSFGQEPGKNVLPARVTFTVETNVKALTIHGASEQAAVSLEVEKSGTAILLKDVAASIPVSTLKTGMELRDKHMRERIFLAQDGTTPDVTFKAAQASCQAATECAVKGELQLRGTSRPATLLLKLVETLPGQFEARGEMVVRFSEFGIAIPNQFGVKVQDEVRVAVDCKAKSALLARSSR
jgi:polyisoprenoid-binding protein YceI